jgi:hypothetical protein
MCLYRSIRFKITISLQCRSVLALDLNTYSLGHYPTVIRTRTFRLVEQCPNRLRQKKEILPPPPHHVNRTLLRRQKMENCQLECRRSTKNSDKLKTVTNPKQILVRRHDGMMSHGRFRCTYVYNIKMDLKIGCKVMELIQLD